MNWEKAFNEFLAYMYEIGHSEYSPNQIWELKNAYESAWRSVSAQQSVHLTALRRGRAASIFINLVLLAVVLFTIGGR